MTRTRIPALLLVGFSLVGLMAACGKDSKDNSQSSKGSTNETTTKLAAASLAVVAFVLPLLLWEFLLLSFPQAARRPTSENPTRSIAGIRVRFIEPKVRMPGDTAAALKRGFAERNVK